MIKLLRTQKSWYIIITTVIFVLFISAYCSSDNNCFKDYNINIDEIKTPAINFNPERYICYRTDQINVDGVLNEEHWQSAKWTNDFVDIEGDLKPVPLYRTRAKMLWDDNFLYVAAELIEPHIWARLKQRDTVIFYDNDFEVFIDPDGDTHEYMEFEMNAYNTVWDLLLTKPYRDNGRVADAWNINGIKTAVDIHGTLNDPGDTDDKWVVELAFPLNVLTEFGNMPGDGTQWRINFSRVNWRVETDSGFYRKALNPETGKIYREYNWVWSPQGLINMHYPETWGYLQFSEILAGQDSTEFKPNPDEEVKWNLRTLYYAQRNMAAQKGYYTSKPEELYDYGYKSGDYKPCILVKPFGYEAFIISKDSSFLWTIDNSGKIYRRKTE